MRRVQSCVRNSRGQAVVETAIVMVLLTALTWGIFEIFLTAWLKLAAVEAAYHSARARVVFMNGSISNPEVLSDWPRRLSVYLLVVPQVHSSSDPMRDVQTRSDLPLREVTATVKVGSPRFFILGNWAHARIDMQAQQSMPMSPGGLADLMDRSYPDGDRDL